MMSCYHIGGNYTVETQIINEQMTEDINGVLNAGDVPEMYYTSLKSL